MADAATRAQREQAIIRLARQGYSARDIGGMIGIPRNSVISTVHRLGHTLTGLKEREPAPIEAPPPKPVPKIEPRPVDPIKDPRLCVAAGCRNTRLRQNLHRLCHEHDQQRIAAKKTAA